MTLDQDTLTKLTADQWREFVEQNSHAHLLQTAAWGELKADFGWEAVRLKRENMAGVQILFRRLPLGLRFAYIPKGPIGEQASLEDKTFWSQVDRQCRRRRAVFLKIEPDEEQIASFVTPPADFQISPHAVQPLRTIVVDLSDDLETILGNMKQKTRYNIRLAEKKGVHVHLSTDIELFYQLMLKTSEREEFGIHSLEYYRKAYELFHPSGRCELFMAEFEGTPLAALLVFAQGERAWYLYGASTSLYREKMPTYLLQWEAMKWAKNLGCSSYDLWGVPDYDQHTLESDFMERTDGLWGVYRFKRGFGGRVIRSMGPWDRIYQPLLYNLYLRWMGRGRIIP
jgi:peptidoglycan pentaglycine glycine transferase (the first glycine)